jgi:hypothetical protein
MDDVAGIQAIGLGGLRLSCIATPKGHALRQEFSPRCPMDRAIHSRSAEERAVRGIHDRIDRTVGDISFDCPHSLVHGHRIPPDTEYITGKNNH